VHDTDTSELDPAPKCQDCGRMRRPGEPDYTPVQAALGQTLGWYSNDDGEFCGDCLGALMLGQRS
jgi:hypothetical protein